MCYKQNVLFIIYLLYNMKEGKMRECNNFDWSKIDFFQKNFLQKFETFFFCCCCWNVPQQCWMVWLNTYKIKEDIEENALLLKAKYFHSANCYCRSLEC